MSVTIQQIAERAGVSRGTVDRALNKRGRINPDVAERICNLADEMGYIQKKRTKNKGEIIKIGVVTQLAKSAFMLEVNRGIQKAKELLQISGVEVIVKEGNSVDEEEQIKVIDELVQEGIQGLALMPVDCDSIREKINWLINEKKISVVTFNSDIVGTQRSCYVGMDNQQSGRAAAGLMNILTQGTGKILIITGFFSNHVNSTRVDGFLDEIKKSYPKLEIAGVQGSFDEADEVKKIIKNALLGMPGINGVFVVSGGQEGIQMAYEELKLDKRPATIIYDLTPDNRKALKENIADFLIDQEGYVQGYEPPCILADFLQKNEEIDEEFKYTEINIRTKYNI